MYKSVSGIPAVLLAFSIAPAIVQAQINPTASQIALRTDCGVLDDCFSSMSEVTDWISATRQPSAEAPLLVDIGAGTFGQYVCGNSGWTTLRGAGVNTTKISASNEAISVQNCVDLTFQNLTVTSSGTGSTVFWRGGGNSTWSDVEIQVNGVNSQTWAWNDSCSGSAALAVHYWFGSKIVATSGFYNTSFNSACGDTWFYGGEIAAISGSPATAVNNLLNDTVKLSGNAILRVFGSAIRNFSLPNNTVNFGHPMRGVDLAGNSSFHMHGGIISMDGSNAVGGSKDVIAINAPLGTTAHVVDTAFTVKPLPGGNAIRLSGPGVKSPYQWFNSDQPPAVVSQHGADTFVETDCSSTGDCEGAGTETHLMISNDSCNTAGKWFNVVTGKCRGE